jgi:hypothetical protein
VEKYGTARQVTADYITLRMRNACAVTKATDTYSEYEIIISFPLQQWIGERSPVLSYM